MSTHATSATARTTNHRTIANAARGTVIVGSGLALGVLSAHFYSQAALDATAKEQSAATAAAQPVKPKVVTVVRTKHVKSDPIIVYRQVPVSSGGSSSGTSIPSSGGSYSGGGSSGGSQVAPAPSAPQQAAPKAPPAASSGAS